MIRVSIRFITVCAAVVQLLSSAYAQELDRSDTRREQRERQEKVSKLSTEEQLQLRAAQQKAAEDPAVKEAVAKRNEAIKAFRDAFTAAMIKADPKIVPILEKIAVNPEQGY